MADSGHPPAELHERLLICRTIKLNAGAHGGHRRCCHAQMRKNAQNKPQIARLILCVRTTLQVYCNLFLTFCLFYKKSVPAWASPRKPLFLARRPAHIRPAHPATKSAAALFRSLQHPGLRPAGQTVLRTVSAAPPPAAASGGRPCGPTDPPRDAARPLSRRPAAYPPGRSDHPHHCTLSSGCRRPLSG